MQSPEISPVLAAAIARFPEHRHVHPEIQHSIQEWDLTPWYVQDSDIRAMIGEMGHDPDATWIRACVRGDRDLHDVQRSAITRFLAAYHYVCGDPTEEYDPFPEVEGDVDADEIVTEMPDEVNVHLLQLCHDAAAAHLRAFDLAWGYAVHPSNAPDLDDSDTVYLFEDNGGGLTLVHQGVGHDVSVLQFSETFENNAAGALSDGTGDWTLARHKIVVDHQMEWSGDAPQLIATFSEEDGLVVCDDAESGAAERAYLGGGSLSRGAK